MGTQMPYAAKRRRTSSSSRSENGLLGCDEQLMIVAELGPVGVLKTELHVLG